MLERYQDPEVKKRKQEYDRQRRQRLKDAGEKQFSEAQRQTHYRKRYGIDINIYEKMLESQNGCCAICGTAQAELKKTLAVDHCHVTGRVRGLLCDPCNKGLGYFRDSLEIMSRAIDYLKD